MTSQPPTSGPELAEHRLDLGNPLRDRILTAIDADEPASEPRHLLAQMNIARFRATMDDPSMAGHDCSSLQHTTHDCSSLQRTTHDDC